MAAIPSHLLLRRREDLLANDLSQTELVMLDTQRGAYFGLQDVGKVVWEQLATPTTLDEICEHLLTRFEVDEETCRGETAAFLEVLQHQGLVEVEGGDDGP